MERSFDKKNRKTITTIHERGVTAGTNGTPKNT
jgi:hypothetical protein